MEYIREDGTKETFTTILEDKENATVFRHFKGNLYRIITMGKDSNTLKDLVVYQGEYSNKPCWIREETEFFSLVNTKKYPNVTQKYRFEKIK